MKHLINFMAENGMTQEDFAKLSGLSRSYVAEIASGAKRPGRNAIEKISAATEGNVPASAWFADRRPVDRAST